MADELFVEVTEPDKSPRRIVLEGSLEFGRECDGEVINDGEVSRRHLKLLPSPNGLRVIDLGSSNGTFVNGARITEPTTLRTGDVVRMGRTLLTVGAPSAPATMAPPPLGATQTMAPSAPTTAAPSAPSAPPTTIAPAAPEAPVRPGAVRPAPPPVAPPAPAAAGKGAGKGAGRGKAPAVAPVANLADVKPRVRSTAGAMMRRLLGLAVHQPLAEGRAVLVGAFFLVMLSGQLHRVDALVPLKSASAVFPLAVLLAASGVCRASYVAREVQHGFFDRLLLSTSRRFPILAGAMIADFIMGAVVAIPMVLIGLALGLHFATGVGGMAVIVAMAGLWAMVYGAFWYGIAFGSGDPGYAPLEYGIMALLLFVSPALVPRADISGWFSHVVPFNPVTYLVDAIFTLQSGRWDGGALINAAIAIVAVGAVSLIVAGAAGRRRVRETLASRAPGKPPKVETPEQSEADMLRAALEAERQARLRLEERLAAEK